MVLIAEMLARSLCCVKLTIGARLIAVVGLLISVFAMKQLVLELTEETTPGSIGVFLVGVHSQANSSHHLYSKHEVNYYLLFCFVFSIAYVLSSALLIWGTIVEERWCTIPWLVAETMRFFAHVGGLIYYVLPGGHGRPSYQTWQLVISGLSIGASLYMLVVVWFAQLTWLKTEPPQAALESSVRLREVPRIIIEDYDEGWSRTVQ